MDAKGRKVVSNIADLQAAGGKTMQYIIGKTDLEIYPPELAQGFWAADRSVIDSGIPIINREEAGLDSQGKPVSVLTTKVPLCDGQGKIIGLVGTGRDITERKKAEETLLRSQQETAHANRLLLALSQAAQAVQRVRTQEEVYAAIQEQMNRLGYNATVFELAGEGKNLRIAYLNYASNLVHRGEKMIGLSMRDYRIHPRQGSIYQRVLTQGETVHVEDGAEAVAETLPRRLRLLARPAAELFHLHSSTFAPLLVGNETIGIFSATGLDLTEMDNPAITAFARQAAIAIQNARLYEQAQQEISERKQAEEALRESEEKYRSIFEDIQDVYYETSFDGTVLEVSPSIELISKGQYHREDLIGRSMYAFYADTKYRDALIAAMQKTVRVTDFEVTLRNRDNSLIPCSISAKIQFNAQGNPEKIMGSMHDISERKQAEQILKEYSEHLEEMVEDRTRDLRNTQEQLVRKEKLAVMGQLAGSVGHELRNPLGVISNSVYYLKMVQPDVNEKIKKHHAMIEQEVHNAAQIVGDLLDYARNIATDPKPGSVPELMEHTLSRFPVPASIRVSLKIPADLPQVYADPLHVEQILGNLIMNGCQAMKDGSKLTISARAVVPVSAREQKKHMVAIAVKDTGKGITPENMKKLFEPLFSTKINGIGLGLAVSKKLAEANGGRIEVESEGGKGSTFTLYLPVKEGS